MKNRMLLVSFIMCVAITTQMFGGEHTRHNRTKTLDKTNYSPGYKRYTARRTPGTIRYILAHSNDNRNVRRSGSYNQGSSRTARARSAERHTYSPENRINPWIQKNNELQVQLAQACQTIEWYHKQYDQLLTDCNEVQKKAKEISECSKKLQTFVQALKNQSDLHTKK